MQSACAKCKIKISGYVKKQKAKGLLSNVRTKAPLSKLAQALNPNNLNLKSC